MPTLKTGRITATYIRKAIQQEQFGLTDEEVFTSRAFARIISTIGKVMTGRISQPVSARIIWEPDLNKVAYTDNLEIVVNAAHPIIQKLSTRHERYCFILGSVFHEFGHCAYTDFKMLGDYLEEFLKGNIPLMPVITAENEDGFKMIRDIQRNGEKARFLIMLIFRNFDNLFEDVFVDFWISRDFPGSHRQCLEMLNKTMYGEKISDLMERQKEKFGDDRVSMWSLYTASLISFLLLGYVNYGDLSDSRLAEIKSRIEKIDRDIHLDINDRKHILRKKRQNDMLAANWDLIMHDITSGTLMIDDPLQENSAGAEDKELGEEEKEELKKALEDMLGQQPSNHSPDRQGGMIKDNLEPDIDGERTAPVPKNGQGDEHGDDKDAFEQFQKLLKSMSEKKAEVKIEDQHLKMLEESAAESLSDFDCSAGTKIEVVRERIHDPAKERQYNLVWPELKKVSSQIQKKLLAHLEYLGEEETVHGLINGKHLHNGGLYRRDGQLFKKRLEPSGRPELVVVILTDHSTSMECEAKARGEINLFKRKITAVAYAALILYDFCVALGIPVMVVGHYAQGDISRKKTFTVTLNVNASFERLDINDRYRIIDTECEGGNRDGTALQFCVHELSKRTEEIKMLFALSDGEPTAYSIKEDGVDHIKQTLREAKRKGIRVFSSALDEDIENIMDIYSNETGAKCYEMTDLARLPVELIRIIKRYLV